MITKLSVYCDKIIEAGWLFSVILIPLFFNVYSSRVFEPDKLTLLRSIVLVMIVAWLIKVLERVSCSRCIRHSGSVAWMLCHNSKPG